MTPTVLISATDVLASTQPPVSADCKARLFDVLEAAGIDHIEIRFSGSGDSGCIDETSAYVNTGTPDAPQQTSIAVPDTEILWPALPVGGVPQLTEQPLKDVLDDVAFDCLAATSHGWENNDGADGTVTLLCGVREIRVDMNEYYTESYPTSRTF